MPNLQDVEKPDWLDLPEEQIKPEEVWFWTCHVRFAQKPWSRFAFWKKYRPAPPTWRVVFTDSEEVEAFLALDTDYQTPASDPFQITLAQALKIARALRSKGIQVMGHRSGKWVVLRELPADVPYYGEPSSG